MTTVRAATSILLAAAIACGPDVDPADHAPRPADPNISLRSIMRGMDAAASRVATGVWTDDPELVRGGAAAIADHPPIPRRELELIQETLGEEFARFARMDQQVHGLAVTLTRLGEREAGTDEILATLQEMQAGCVACHRAFRPRLAPLLPPGP